MDRTVSVEELLEKARSYDRQIVSVKGQFIAMYTTSVICAFRDALEVTSDRPQIKLAHPDLADRCFQIVSPYVGGPWYYHDPATVTGRFLADPEPRIVEISTLIIHRSGSNHYVHLQPGKQGE